jgi:hypothetical protein
MDGKGPDLRGFLHRPENPSGEGIALTHGAGANCDSPLLRAVAAAFCEVGMTVLRFNLPFRQTKAFGPPMRGSAGRDQEGVRKAVEALRRQVSGRIYMGGHSYGGRQTTMLAASDGSMADGLLLLSYPLHPPEKPEQMRTSHFPDLRLSSLFVSGTRDGFGTPEELSEALKLIPASTRLATIESSGHELLTKRNEAEVLGTILAEFEGLFAGD